MLSCGFLWKVRDIDSSLGTGVHVPGEAVLGVGIMKLKRARSTLERRMPSSDEGKGAVATPQT